MRIVWDFGAVLFRWRPAALLARALPHHVHDEASAAHWQAQVFQHYGGDWGEFDRGTVEPEALIERIAARTGLAPEEVRAVVDAVPDELAPMDDSVALLRHLRTRGHRQFWLSNMPAPYAAHLTRTHGFLHECFDSGVFSHEVQLNKPEAALFRLAHARFGGGAAGETLFIDDHPANVEAARAHGWCAVQFIGAEQLARDLAAAGAL
jgi:HAD superfamily hydrolase (TIGR01509 family)